MTKLWWINDAEGHSLHIGREGHFSDVLMADRLPLLKRRRKILTTLTHKNNKNTWFGKWIHLPHLLIGIKECYMLVFVDTLSGDTLIQVMFVDTLNGDTLIIIGNTYSKIKQGYMWQFGNF